MLMLSEGGLSSGFSSRPMPRAAPSSASSSRGGMTSAAMMLQPMPVVPGGAGKNGKSALSAKGRKHNGVGMTEYSRDARREITRTSAPAALNSTSSNKLA